MVPYFFVVERYWYILFIVCRLIHRYTYILDFSVTRQDSKKGDYATGYKANHNALTKIKRNQQEIYNSMNSILERNKERSFKSRI